MRLNLLNSTISQQIPLVFLCVVIVNMFGCVCTKELMVVNFYKGRELSIPFLARFFKENFGL